MDSPFERKTSAAIRLDRACLHLILLLFCVFYFLFLFRSVPSSLIAGSALFVLCVLCILQIEQRTLRRRDRLLRERVGGMIALEDLLLMPAKKACGEVLCLLCRVLPAAPAENGCMRYGGEIWLVRLAQCPQGKSISEGDVLSAHRARIETGADQCVLAATASFSPEATRTAEWMDPPIRLISGRQLASLFGRMHPATDEDIARHAARRRKPFSRERIRALALSPVKLRRYLLCAFLLLVMYLFSGSAAALLSCLFSFGLAFLCRRENRRSFRL